MVNNSEQKFAKRTAIFLKLFSLLTQKMGAGEQIILYTPECTHSKPKLSSQTKSNVQINDERTRASCVANLDTKARKSGHDSTYVWT